MNCRIAVALFFTACSGFQARTAEAQATFVEKPFGILWAPDLNNGEFLSYFHELAEEFDLEGDWLEDMNAMDPEIGISKTHLRGSIFYLRKGLVPMPAIVSFRAVEDEQEFRKLIQQAKAIYSDNTLLQSTAQLSGSGDRYSLDITTKLGNGKGTMGIPSKLHFLYRDGLLYQADFEEMYDMKLPTTAELELPESKRRFNTLAEFDLGQIPKGYKDVLWNMFNISAGTSMQQYDDEDEIRYGLRRASADCIVSMVKSFVYGIDQLRFELELGDGEQAIALNVKLESQSNSDLATDLKLISGPRSRFSGLIDERTPFTFASTWHMPPAFRKLLRASAQRLQQISDGAYTDDAEAAAAVKQAIQVLDDTASDGTFDAFAKLGADPNGRMTIFGGLALNGPARLRDALLILIRDEAAAGHQFDLTTTDAGDEIFTVSLETPTGELKDFLPTEVSFGVRASALWFAVGRDGSSTMLADLMQTASDRARGGTRGYQFLLDLNISDWMQSGGEGLGALPEHALAAFERGIDQGFEKARRKLAQAGGKQKNDDGSPSERVFTNYAEKTLTKDGTFRLAVRTEESGFNAGIRIGAGVARFATVRYMILLRDVMGMKDDIGNFVDQQQKARETVPEEPVGAK